MTKLNNDLEKKAEKLTETYKYSLVAQLYYKKGYDKCKQDILADFREKYKEFIPEELQDVDN